MSRRKSELSTRRSDGAEVRVRPTRRANRICRRSTYHQLADLPSCVGRPDRTGRLHSIVSCHHPALEETLKSRAETALFAASCICIFVTLEVVTGTARRTYGVGSQLYRGHRNSSPKTVLKTLDRLGPVLPPLPRRIKGTVPLRAAGKSIDRRIPDGLFR